MTEGEIARVNILCEGLNCGVNLHRFAFLKGAQEARIYDEQRIYVTNYLETGANFDYLQGEIASRKSRCQICSSDRAKKLCANNHFICIQCTVIISFSKYAFCCPTCGLRVKNKLLEDILAGKWTIIGLKGSQTALIHCRKCKVYKDLLGFTVLKELKHDCWICDVCLLAMEIEEKPRKCEYCGDKFPKKQLKAIKNWQNDQLAQTAPDAIKAAEMGIPAEISRLCVQCQIYKAESEFQCWQKCPSHYQKCDKCYFEAIPPIIDEDKCCLCGNIISKGHFSCKGNCYCSVCHFKRMLFAHSSQCPKCNSPCKGRLFTHIDCNSCMRSILTNREGKMTIAGFCANGHILCQHCVMIIAEDRLTCPVCFLEVQGQGIAEIRKAQQTLSLACFCDNKAAKKQEQLPCGHFVHTPCKPGLYVCRICGALIPDSSARPTMRTVYDFAG